MSSDSHGTPHSAGIPSADDARVGRARDVRFQWWRYGATFMLAMGLVLLLAAAAAEEWLHGIDGDDVAHDIERRVAFSHTDEADFESELDIRSIKRQLPAADDQGELHSLTPRGNAAL